MPHFSYWTVLYCAKPRTNYLASKPKGLSQEKSLLNVIHHMLSSVIYWLQEDTEKKNRIFSHLNFKDQDDVQMTFKICFFTSPFPLSGVSHFPLLTENSLQSTPLKGLSCIKVRPSTVLLKINEKTSTFPVLSLQGCALSRWIMWLKGFLWEMPLSS